MKPIIVASFIAIFASWSVPVHAQYSVNWFSIDGGAGQSGGGGFALSGTIGQPDAGAMGGGGYTVTGGFWAFPTSVAPLLSIERLAGNVRVFWPLPGTGFSLQQAGALTGASWTTGMFTYQTNSTHIFVIFPPAGSSKFFRLQAP
jgi:hypothetical protein